MCVCVCKKRRAVWLSKHSNTVIILNLISKHSGSRIYFNLKTHRVCVKNDPFRWCMNKRTTNVSSNGMFTIFSTWVLRLVLHWLSFRDEFGASWTCYSLLWEIRNRSDPKRVALNTVNKLGPMLVSFMRSSFIWKRKEFSVSISLQCVEKL